ncbi:MAG: FAD:protein FMN transferase, partial [Comamonadaceae bacterium]
DRWPGGGPWRIAVDTAPGQRSCTLDLDDLAIATSGDAFHAFEHAGRRYSHTIDPRTGMPVAHDVASVTVLHAECMQADALATVLCVLGPDAGMAFARQHGVAALMARRGAAGWSEVASPAFAALVP